MCCVLLQRVRSCQVLMSMIAITALNLTCLRLLRVYVFAVGVPPSARTLVPTTANTYTCPARQYITSMSISSGEVVNAVTSYTCGDASSQDIGTSYSTTANPVGHPAARTVSSNLQVRACACHTPIKSVLQHRIQDAASVLHDAHAEASPLRDSRDWTGAFGVHRKWRHHQPTKKHQRHSQSVLRLLLFQRLSRPVPIPDSAAFGGVQSSHNPFSFQCLYCQHGSKIRQQRWRPLPSTELPRG